MPLLEELRNSCFWLWQLATSAAQAAIVVVLNFMSFLPVDAPLCRQLTCLCVFVCAAHGPVIFTAHVEISLLYGNMIKLFYSNDRLFCSYYTASVITQLASVPLFVR